MHLPWCKCVESLSSKAFEPNAYKVDRPAVGPVDGLEEGSTCMPSSETNMHNHGWLCYWFHD